MNIVHLLSQNHLTGAEVYAVQLIDHQVAQTHAVFQVSNAFFMKSRAVQIPLAVETRSKLQFWKNAWALRKFLKEKNIHVIHTHSRASAKLAFWARWGLPTGQVSTIHGRQHRSISKRLINHYGDFLISVCENIQQHLIQDFNYKKSRLSVIRNPISKLTFSFSKLNSDVDQHLRSKSIKIAVVGRTSGPKGRRTEQILTALPGMLKKLNVQAQFFLVGGQLPELTLPTNLSIQEISSPELTSANYEKFDLVIGSGRVALESLITGIPTISFGEAKYLGLTRLFNLSGHFNSNFGDIDPQQQEPVLNLQLLENNLKDLFSEELNFLERKQISEIVQGEFNLDKIAKRIFRIYESSYFLSNYSKWIPILMYHKIPKETITSQHKIFVTANNFRKHLDFFKKRNMTTLTFGDLKKFKSAEISFKSFPKKPLILTFDDGYQDNLDYASPLLKEFGFKAQLFLLANKNIDSNIWDHSDTEQPHSIVSGEKRQLWKSSAFEIGSHGFSHQRLPQMSEPEARKELQASKKNLETEFETDIPVYAFTYGDTTSECGRLAFEEGYDYAVNTDSGGLLLEEDPFSIFRVNIFPDETILGLYKKTSTWYRNYYFRKRKK